MGNIIDENEKFIVLQHPINVVIANPMSPSTAVYTARYSPLARDSIVTFSKGNIVSFSGVDKDLEKHYDSMVQYYSSKEYRYHSEREENEDVNEYHQQSAFENNLKSKLIH